MLTEIIVAVIAIASCLFSALSAVVIVGVKLGGLQQEFKQVCQVVTDNSKAISTMETVVDAKLSVIRSTTANQPCDRHTVLLEQCDSRLGRLERKQNSNE